MVVVEGAPVVEGLGKRGVEANGRAVVGQGLVRAAVFGMEAAPVVEGRGIGGVEADGRAVVGQGFVRAAVVVVEDAPVVVVPGERPEADGRRVVAHD